MKAEETKLYTSVEAYLNGPEGMNNEVCMWAVAGGLLVREVMKKVKGHKFGGLHQEKGLEMKAQLPKISILDVCSGPGNFPNYLSLYYPKISVVGIDINNLFIEEANKRFSKYGWRFLNRDATNFDLSRKFDFVTASSAYHHIQDQGKIDFLKKIREHLSTEGKVLVCENILPSYKSNQERSKSVANYYSDLIRYFASGNATPQAINAIQEVYALEKSGIEEHKVDFHRFKQHICKAGLEIELDIPVWQTRSFRKDNSGSHVFLLKKA